MITRIFVFLTPLLLLLPISDSLDMRDRAEVSPVIIRNGTDEPVVLDCNYNYDHFETAGLTVKWFWHRDHEPVYQWIPGGVPEVRGILKGKVNVSYLASEDEYSSHRALQILKPTSDLSGKYTCTVSSYYDEKKQSIELLVYAPTEFLELKFLKPTPTTVNATCSAHGLYPKPAMSLYARTQTDKYEIRNVNIHIKRHSRTDGKVDTWEEPVTWETWGDGINKIFKNHDKNQTKKKKRSTRKAKLNIISRNTRSERNEHRSHHRKSLSSIRQNNKSPGRNGRSRRQKASVSQEGYSSRGDLLPSPSHRHNSELFNSDDTEPFGWYSIYADVVLTDSNLHEDGQLLECEVLLPGTTYSERTNVVYFPGYDAMELYAQESTSGSVQWVLPHSVFFSSLMLLMF